jgi:hypothetical protein
MSSATGILTSIFFFYDFMIPKIKQNPNCDRVLQQQHLSNNPIQRND